MPALTLYKPFVFRKDLFYFSTQSLYILDKINGKIKSLHNVRMECNYPVIYKNHLCASYQNKIFNYNIKDRKFDWIKTIKGNIYKGITLDNWKLIFATSKGKIYSVQTKRGITEFETGTGTGTAIYALPVVYEDYIYIGDVNGIFYAVNKTSGKIIWKFKTFGKISSSAAVSKTNIYFGSEAHFIYNFDRLKLTKIWNSSERTAFGTSPVIFGDYLITSGNTGEVYFVLKKNGDFRGSYFIGSKVNGKIKIHDNKIIFTTESGYIHILSEKRN
jgi:outer membrane protein assembly factor BamB